MLVFFVDKFPFMLHEGTYESIIQTSSVAGLFASVSLDLLDPINCLLTHQRSELFLLLLATFASE